MAHALQAVLAHLANDTPAFDAARAAALQHWPTNPEVDHVLGRKLSQKYRFAEGAAAQRRALDCDPKYQPARLQLAQDLLRLGNDAEGWELVRQVADADGYNLLAYNLQTLHDSVDHFRTLTGDGVVLRMEPREAEMFGDQVLAWLVRARRELCARYQVELAGPVLVEMFPRQSDFAIRTFGLPGGAGFLGVCFGSVITALSPSANENPTNWQATLWHEFCHAVTLGKTRNRMPRWLSEGISVYEERRVDPAWGQAINPRYRQMLLDEGLPKVSQLSGSFLRPASPLHLQFAYFESSLVVEWLVERYGFEALLSLLDDLGRGLSLDDALTRLGGSVAEVDAGFATYARQRAEQFAPDTDWTTTELPDPPTIQNLATFLNTHPHNHAGWRTLARLHIQAGDWSAADRALRELARLYPEDNSAEGLYFLQARVARERGDVAGEVAALERWVALSAAPVAALERLGELHLQAERWEPALATARRWLGVSPQLPGPHRLAATAAGSLRDWRAQVASLRALGQLQPTDPAGLQLQLGQAWLELGDLDQARRAAL
ncbi:MAG: peptidase MA family metallohydrolase, partial [Planctomycetaceae bacterium]